MDDVKAMLSGVSETQLQQIISALNIKDGDTNHQVHAAMTKPKTPPGSGYEEDDWFG